MDTMSLPRLFIIATWGPNGRSLTEPNRQADPVSPLHAMGLSVN